MILGIIGYGLVGQTLFEGFTEKGHTVMVNDTDPDRTMFTKKELAEECEIIFICVDTPTNELGCNLRNVYEAFNELHFEIAIISRSQEGTALPIVAVKSTVLPGTVDTLCAMYPYVCSNPEFMRQDSALEDFLEPDRIVVGVTSERVRAEMKTLYKDWECPQHYVSPKEAELIKYFSNAYLVNKVAFSQEVDHVCSMLNADPLIVMNSVWADSRIHPSHLHPFRGKIPRDSMCLPKDLKAFIVQLEKSGYPALLFKTVYAGGVEGAVLVPSLEIRETEK
jgi:UDPglucose 6-dehydrogenase